MVERNGIGWGKNITHEVIMRNDVTTKEKFSQAKRKMPASATPLRAYPYLLEIPPPTGLTDQDRTFVTGSA
jgi:hypothetical protein